MNSKQAKAHAALTDARMGYRLWTQRICRLTDDERAAKADALSRLRLAEAEWLRLTHEAAR